MSGSEDSCMTYKASVSEKKSHDDFVPCAERLERRRQKRKRRYKSLKKGFNIVSRHNLL